MSTEGQAAELLVSFRKRAGMSQDALARMIGVSKTLVSFWENGQDRIDGSKLADIAGALKLLTDDSERLTFACLPALDPLWLARQELSRQAGMLLAAYRQRAGMAQIELAGAMGVSPRTVIFWEHGRSPLNAAMLAAAATALRLSHEETTRLIIVRWPALDPLWLAGQQSVQTGGHAPGELPAACGHDAGRIGRGDGSEAQDRHVLGERQEATDRHEGAQTCLALSENQRCPA